MILIYTKNITPRLEYIFGLFFNTLLKSDITFTTSREEFTSSELPKINYSDTLFGDELFIKAHNLLFEEDIKAPGITVFDWNKDNDKYKVFFPAGADSFLPFDLFAAGFYLVTRYEEHLPFKADEYGRFEAKESFAFRNGFLDQPVINIWADILKKTINRHYPGIIKTTGNYCYIPTIDIDNAYSFLHKGMARAIGGGLKSLANLRIKETSERAKVLLGSKPDPFDTYNYIKSVDEKYGLSSTYFFLVGRLSKHDRNVPANNKHYRSLIRSISEKNNTGIHPSYHSNSNIKILKKEIESLSSIINNDITISRQHFIKLSFPETYKNLINYGIKEDYSMGYPSHAGYRAGICTPYRYYDLSSETVTDLTIFPFQVMDMTLRGYMELTPEQAIEEIKTMIDKIKKVNGTFISLWHNESLSETNGWEGWRRVYEEMYRMANV